MLCPYCGWRSHRPLRMYQHLRREYLEIEGQDGSYLAVGELLEAESRRVAFGVAESLRLQQMAREWRSRGRPPS